MVYVVDTGFRFSIRRPSYQYKNFHFKYKTVRTVILWRWKPIYMEETFLYHNIPWDLKIAQPSPWGLSGHSSHLVLWTRGLQLWYNSTNTLVPTTFCFPYNPPPPPPPRIIQLHTHVNIHIYLYICLTARGKGATLHSDISFSNATVSYELHPGNGGKSFAMNVCWHDGTNLPGIANSFCHDLIDVSHYKIASLQDCFHVGVSWVLTQHCSVRRLTAKCLVYVSEIFHSEL